MSTANGSVWPRPSPRRGGVLVGVLAVALLAHPLYLWPQLGNDPNALLLAGVVRPLLTVGGGVLLTYGGLVASRDTWRPVTPLTALLFPVVTGLAVLGLQWYDEAVLGLDSLRHLDNNPVFLGAVSLVFLVGGSLVRHERTRAVIAFLVGCLVAFLLGVGLDQTRPPIALASAIALGLAAVVIGGVGYVLTAPR